MLNEIIEALIEFQKSIFTRYELRVLLENRRTTLRQINIRRMNGSIFIYLLQFRQKFDIYLS